MLPRERVGLLLDPGAPYLPLCSLAGFLHDTKDPAKSVPGGGMLAGIGFIAGVRCMVVASDSGIEAGAIQPRGLEKILRVQEIALENKLPFVHLVESAGANLMKYQVEGFVLGGGLFRNLARLSAAGLPVITVQHGSGTAGGAYMPGLSDVVIMVRGRSRAFLAGPPLLKAATGEIATEEELGGAEMHTAVSGLGEYLAEDDREALGIARQVVSQTGWQTTAAASASPPRFDADDLLVPHAAAPPRTGRHARGHAAHHRRRPTSLNSSRSTVLPRCARRRALRGHPVGIISNNGPIDVAGANKATHFIQWMCQLGHPIVYLQNTTGYMVGKDSEQTGMIKHGSKMIQAVTNATVPQITIQCGASFGAGNYGMCGRGYAPRFLFSWPNARTAVMGGEQAAKTMQIVAEAGMARKGIRHRHARGAGADEGPVRRHRAEVRVAGRRVHHQRPGAGRRRDRPARHPRGAHVLSRHRDRSRVAPAAAHAVRRRAHVTHTRPQYRPPKQRRQDMQFTHEHREIQKTLKRFIDEQINPHVDEWEAAEIFPAHEVFKQMGQLGLLGLTKPEAYGGMGLDYSYSVAMAEALGHIHCGGVPMAIGVQTDMCTPALARFGSDELRAQFLAPAIAGDAVGCIGVSEPGAGSDVAAIKTVARKDGDDYVISGQKMWITNSLQADWMCMLVNTSEGPAHKNKSLVMVPLRENGKTIKGFEVGQKIRKIGMNSSDTGLLFFDEVRVPQRYRIGAEGARASSTRCSSSRKSACGPPPAACRA